MDGYMDGWMEVKAVLRIAYSYQKCKNGKQELSKQSSYFSKAGNRAAANLLKKIRIFQSNGQIYTFL
jgi:hypothetical protein